ncbi:MAG: hypothetical protein M5U22_00770 [Thermoleophilia bacterium]|nr:hypothetical protein [Thermoleophilia bacterium]
MPTKAMAFGSAARLTKPYAKPKKLQPGDGWVVDLDLEAFFDRANHDAFMARVARKVKDKKVPKPLRAYLNAGIIAEGVLVRP